MSPPYDLEDCDRKPKGKNVNGFRNSWGHRVTIPLLLTLIFTTAHTSHAASRGEVVLGKSLEEEVNRLADQLADTLHTQESLFAGRDPVTLIDQFLTQELARQIEISKTFAQQIPDSRAKIEELRLPGPIFNADSFTLDKATQRELLKSDIISLAARASLIPSIIAVAVGFYNGNYDIAWIGMGTVLAASLTDEHYSIDDQQVQLAEAKFDKKVSTAVREAVFQRLLENGVKVPKRNREEWLMSLIDGGKPLANWENLSNREKIKNAKKYAAFLQGLAAIISADHPQASEILLKQSRQLETEIDGARWYRFRSFRALQAGVVKAVNTLAKLDREHDFLSKPNFQELNYLNRIVYDFPEVFTADTAEKLRLSRMELPDAIRAFAPRLIELGGKIELQIQNESVEVERAHKLSKVTYKFTVHIPDREPMTFGAEIVDTEAVKVGSGRELRLPNLDGLEFRRQLTNSMERTQFAETIAQAHEEKYPEKACRHAFSTSGKRLRESVAAAAEELSAAVP